MKTLGFLLLSALLMCAQSLPQIDHKSETAVSALRAIVVKVKACPRIVAYENKDMKGPLAGFRIYQGPPLNVTWDVTQGKSIRAPYEGYLEFDIAQEWWFPESTLKKYGGDHAPTWYTEMIEKPKPTLEHRYEFDLGPTGLELVKSFIREEGQHDWKVYNPDAIGGQCWDKSVREGQTVAREQ